MNQDRGGAMVGRLERPGSGPRDHPVGLVHGCWRRPSSGNHDPVRRKLARSRDDHALEIAIGEPESSTRMSPDRDSPDGLFGYPVGVSLQSRFVNRFIAPKGNRHRGD